ncbi:MAG TPA: DUF2490 domain-containing protein [Flavipsychrobacter sp.]|nr:DUF2490 domain-containing protein [Flavipsychrobacter sp.]
MKIFRPGFIALLLFFFFSGNTNAQRLSDNNNIGWFCSLNTIQLNKKFSLWLEYQWRSDNLVTDWQQSLFRTGIQYNFKNGVSALVGYGYIITYPYGDYPAGPYTIPEHRIFQQLVWNDAIGRVGLNHRIRLEQRYLGKIDQKAPEYKVDDWTYLNRVRYQLRATVPLNKKKLEDKTLFAAAYDELFIGFGKNVNQNIFDQNRIGLLLGYQFNKTLRIEAGFLNQTVQQSGEIGNREVYQYNNGAIVNIYTNLFN